MHSSRNICNKLGSKQKGSYIPKVDSEGACIPKGC